MGETQRLLACGTRVRLPTAGAGNPHRSGEELACDCCGAQGQSAGHNRSAILCAGSYSLVSADVQKGFALRPIRYRVSKRGKGAGGVKVLKQLGAILEKMRLT